MRSSKEMRSDVEMRPIDANDLLLVVDLQYDFCPGGALAVPEGDAVLPLVNRLLDRFPHVGFTQDWHPCDHRSFASAHPGHSPHESIEMPYGRQILWPDHCVQGTRGAELLDGLRTERAEVILRKGYRREIDSYSGFFENDRKTATGLAGYLRDRGVKRIFLAGLALDFCVFYTAVDGRRLGFEVVVVEDACRGIDLNGSLAAARDEMVQAGVELITASEVPPTTAGASRRSSSTCAPGMHDSGPGSTGGDGRAGTSKQEEPGS